MPDSWKRSRRLNPRDPANGARDVDGDGYTELEGWLNSLALRAGVL